MKIEVLMSTTSRNKIEELDLAKKNIDAAVIVNQFKDKEKVSKSKKAVMYDYPEKGVARSRNRLIEHASGDIGIITDDDITFEKNYKEIIEKAYKENDADIIIFNLRKGKDIVGSDKKFYYNKISIMSICSCQITFKIDKIKDNNIMFDERFGIGSTYISGEENIFLKDCLKKGLKILHIPIVINNHPEEETTGENWTDKVIMSKGAFAYRSYREIFLILLFYFSITKHNQYKKNYSFINFMKLFIKGKKEYLREIRG